MGVTLTPLKPTGNFLSRRSYQEVLVLGVRDKEIRHTVGHTDFKHTEVGDIKQKFLFAINGLRSVFWLASWTDWIQRSSGGKSVEILDSRTRFNNPTRQLALMLMKAVVCNFRTGPGEINESDSLRTAFESFECLSTWLKWELQKFNFDVFWSSGC